MEWSQLLGAYGIWLDHQPLSANTKRCYLSRLRAFVSYADSVCLLSDFLSCPDKQRTILEDYSAYVIEQDGLKPESVNNSLSAIDHFLQYLRIPRPRVRRKSWPTRGSVPRLSPDEQARLVEDISKRGCPRDRCIVYLLLFAGLRLSECINLNLDDVSGDGRVLVIRNGVRSQRVARVRKVVLAPAVSVALSEWLEQRVRLGCGQDGNAVFVSDRGKRLSAAGFDYIIRKLGWRSRLNLSAQVLRGTCLWQRLQSGEDVCQLAEMVGLTRVDSLLRYAQNYPGNVIPSIS